MWVKDDQVDFTIVAPPSRHTLHPTNYYCCCAIERGGGGVKMMMNGRFPCGPSLV